jgi:hypothetical protein
MMTNDERVEVGRAAFELQRQFGRDAHKFAARRTETAVAEGDLELAQFWKWVEASVRPRG